MAGWQAQNPIRFMVNYSPSFRVTPSDEPPRGVAGVEVEGLVKRYPKAVANAVNRLSFTVARGEIFAVLGPNGAGKTTLVAMLTTRAKPTAGRAYVAGVDIFADPVGGRAVLGVVPQRNNLDRSLSIRQNLIFHAAYHGVSRARAARTAGELLAAFGLADRAKDKPDLFSGGQAQRVMIARALMHHPAVLFLDEPTTGLDPAARLFVWDRIRELRDRGVTVMLTTHDMTEAEELSNRVGIIDHGQLLALDQPSALKRTLRGNATLEVTVTGIAAPGPLVSLLSELSNVERAEALPSPVPPDPTLRVRIYIHGDPALIIPAVSSAIHSLGGRIAQVGMGEPSLEDVFLHLTGRTLR
jgi:ABC-2 type transport system ATP-binding protein